MQIQLANLGIWELILILVIVMLISGANKLPQLGESLGKALNSFRKSLTRDPNEIEQQTQPGTEEEQAVPFPIHQTMEQLPIETEKGKKPS